MGKDLADVTVHIDEKVDHAKLQEIADEVRRIAGVEAVSFHDDKPHLMVVQYDPGRTNSTSIQQAVNATGVHAEMLGL